MGFSLRWCFPASTRRVCLRAHLSLGAISLWPVFFCFRFVTSARCLFLTFCADTGTPGTITITKLNYICSNGTVEMSLTPAPQRTLDSVDTLCKKKNECLPAWGQLDHTDAPVCAFNRTLRVEYSCNRQSSKGFRISTHDKGYGFISPTDGNSQPLSCLPRIFSFCMNGLTYDWSIKKCVEKTTPLCCYYTEADGSGLDLCASSDLSAAPRESDITKQLSSALIPNGCSSTAYTDTSFQGTSRTMPVGQLTPFTGGTTLELLNKNVASFKCSCDSGTFDITSC